MKLKSLKLANAINVGGHTDNYFLTERFEMNLRDSVLIDMRNRSNPGTTITTTLFNVVCFEADDTNKTTGQSSPAGSSKKTSK